MSAVVVVPIPRLSCSVSVRSKIALLALIIAVRIRSPACSSLSPRRVPNSREMIRTAISLATSPAAWPPVPSPHPARDCARGVAPHPVRHDEYSAVGKHEVVILVSGADYSGVGARSAGETHVDGYLSRAD